MIIQSNWLRPSFNDMARLCVRSFQAHGHEFHLYTYGNVDGVPEGTVIRDAREIIPPLSEWRWDPGHWGEFFSYELLLKMGGCNVGMDMVCLKPFEFPDEHVLAGEYCPEPPATRVNGVPLKAPAGSYVIEHILEKCRAMDLTKYYWGQSGPEVVTDAVRELKIENLVKPPSFFNPVPHTQMPRFLDSVEDVWTKWNLDEAYCLHWWAAKWLWGGYDLDRTYPADCLYEKLKRQYL